MHPVLNRAQQELGIELAAAGDFSLLDGPRRALLISRAERKPTPQTDWLQEVLNSAECIVKNQEVLVAGAGRTAWDAALLRSRKLDGNAIAVFQSNRELAEFSFLLPARHVSVWPKNGTLQPIARDRLIGLLADHADGISIRSGGHMARIANETIARGGCVDERFKARARVLDLSFKPFAGTWKLPQEWNYLTHYTRAPDGAWPGEGYLDYLEWLCGGESSKPRDSFAALLRILTEKLIRPNARLIPGKHEMICFTERRPDEIPSLCRWRRGLRRWSFTPYGIAIRRDYLASTGARSVEYVSEDDLHAAPASKRCYMQRAESPGMNWAEEREWRFPGVLKLAEVPREQLLAVTATQPEARLVESEFGVSAIGGVS